MSFVLSYALDEYYLRLGSGGGVFTVRNPLDAKIFSSEDDAASTIKVLERQYLHWSGRMHSGRAGFLKRPPGRLSEPRLGCAESPTVLDLIDAEREFTAFQVIGS